MYNNLRHFIDRLESEGELLRISIQVSTEFEIAEIADRVSKSPEGGKALLFENTATGFPLAINIFGSKRRICLALGVEELEQLTSRIDNLLSEATSPKNSLWDKLRMLPLLGEMSQWLPTTSKSKGECQQVVLHGEQAKLSLLPILKCWGYDGGRFITLPMVNTLDPDTGIRNTGMYRMQVMDDHTTGMHWHIHKTGARHYESYKRRGERMPISVAIGGDPTYTYAATAPMPDNMDEYLLAGFLRRKKVKLVKSITNDIYVPADCDFVIEGYVDPTQEKVIEGPFGDHTGFYSLQDYYPQFHVTAITHRRDAIYPATIVGIPPQEDAYIAMATERIFLAPIRFAMLPEIKHLYMPTAGTAHNLAIISIEKRYCGQSNRAILSMWGAGQMMFNKYLIVTSEECDPRNTEQLLAALRRCDIKQSVIRSEGVLDVLDHATATNGFGGKLALDCTHTPTSERGEAAWHYAGSDYSICDKYLEQLSLLCIYASPEADIDLSQLSTKLNISNINFIAIFDNAAKGLTSDDLLWLAMANSDPRRDVVISDSTLILDARSKRPGMSGNPARFPNVVTSCKEVVELVDRRWSEYKIGDMIESPSRRYRQLELSQREDW